MADATFSPYLGMEPPVWRNLLARAAIFHAIRSKLSALCDSASGSAVRGAMCDLEVQVRERCTQEGDDEALVKSVAQAWNLGLTRTLGLEHLDPESRVVLSRLQELLGSASSSDPFRQLFSGVATLASALYGPCWRPATLHLYPVRSHPRSGNPESDPYVLTATTPWPPDELEASVELHVFCDAFGPAAYAALPMLLTHECVCHVPARQDRAKNDSTFAEGFLNWPAYFFLEQWAGKLDNELAPEARKHARKLRHLLTSRTDTSEGRARQIGHDAAETLLAWYEDTYGLSRHDSELRVARLAVQVNKVERPLKQKDALVSMLTWPLPPYLERALRKLDAGQLNEHDLLGQVATAA